MACARLLPVVQVREKLKLLALKDARLVGAKPDPQQRLPRRYAQPEDLDA